MRRLKLIVIGAAGAVMGLFLLLLSGVVNFAASSGHWEITDWIMEVAARQSVTLRSIAIEVPDTLDDEKRIMRGAGHYEMVCAACHGSPAEAPQEFARHLTPTPPLLMEQMEHWRPPGRTFWTVKHGIKRTAMPAWPTQLRDDEVWDVVAFIEAMPSLSADDYRALAGDRRVNSCVNCHGEDARGRGAFPRLDIQSPAYLAASLRAYRDGTRASGMMMTAAHGLDDEAIARIAAELGQLAEETPAGPPLGQRIAEQGLSERDIPACNSCHGATARLDYPRLAGQDRTHLERQLDLFLTVGAARGGEHAEIMARAVVGLSADEAAAVVDWYAR